MNVWPVICLKDTLSIKIERADSEKQKSLCVQLITETQEFLRHFTLFSATNKQGISDSMYQELLVNTSVCNPHDVVGLPFVLLSAICLQSQCRPMREHRFGTLIAVLC
jgi:hypothetical protein